MRVLIVDDESPVREQLRRALAPELDVTVAGMAVNGIDALKRIEELAPDVVFLDIEMPGLNGLEVAEQMGRQALVVFVTAYDEYAVKTFDAHAVDYLLKPLDRTRLAKTIVRLREHLAAKTLPPVREALADLRRQRSF